MKKPNPFLPTRFEYDTSPLLWRSPLADELEKPNSYFIKGTRGSGKTSILKTINWRERVENKVLADQIKEPSNCIAVYFRLPEHMSQSMASINWASVTPDAPSDQLMAYSYFSHYLESVALETILEAVVRLRSYGKLKYDISGEATITNEVFEKFTALRSFAPTNSPNTFNDIKSTFDKMHHEMNRAATRGTVSTMLDRLPASEPGELIKFVTSKIMSFINPEKDVHIKVCVDDCEALKESQQIFLNSLVRTSVAPVFWVVTFVASDYETTNTVIHNQKLSDADRKVIDLENTTPLEFRKLCEAVSSLRFFYTAKKLGVESFQGQSVVNLFDLTSILGSFSINQLFDTATKKGLGAKLIDFRDSAQFFLETSQEHLNKEQLKAIGIHNSKTLPFYQCYLLSQLYPGMKIEEFKDKSMAELKAFSALLRRKQVGAYLNMCSQFGVNKPLYAGSKIVLSMSDGCIRDYLELMGSIYDGFSHRRTSRLESFIRRSTPVGIKAQSRWITRCSWQKLEGIKEGKDSIEILTSEVSKVVEGLGWLTQFLQASTEDKRSLRTAERGVFYFDLENLSGTSESDLFEDRDYVQRVLRRAVLEGLLRVEQPFSSRQNLKEGSEAQIAYRLHKRYAAHFCFSYRGAYEPVAINASELLWLCSNSESADAKKWAIKQLDRLPNISVDQMELEFK